MNKYLLLAVLLPSVAVAALAFFKYEKPNGSMYKDCIYKYLDRSYTLTISRSRMCPLTLEVSS